VLAVAGRAAALCTAPARAVIVAAAEGGGGPMLALAGGCVAGLPWTPRIGNQNRISPWRCFVRTPVTGHGFRHAAR